MSQENKPPGSSLWARLPPPVWAATGAAVTLAILGGAIALFGGHRAAPPSHNAAAPGPGPVPASGPTSGPASAQNDFAAQDSATVRLQITAANGPISNAMDMHVWIDGTLVNPRKRFPLRPGTHTLLVTATGYERYGQQIDARPGDHLELPIQLQQASPPLPPRPNRPKAPSAIAASSRTAPLNTNSPARNPTPTAPPPPPPPVARSAIELTCTGHGTALQAGSIHRQEFVDRIILDLPDPQTGRAHLPAILIPAMHGGVVDGWVKLTHVTVTAKDITATLGFNFFEHAAIRVNRASGELSMSGWTEDFAGHCRPADTGL